MNGAVDPTFDPDLGFDGEVRSLIVQADGKVVAGGTFPHVNGQSQSYLVRLLNDDGDVDSDGVFAFIYFLSGVAGRTNDV